MESTLQQEEALLGQLEDGQLFGLLRRAPRRPVRLLGWSPLPAQSAGDTTGDTAGDTGGANSESHGENTKNAGGGRSSKKDLAETSRRGGGPTGNQKGRDGRTEIQKVMDELGLEAQKRDAMRKRVSDGACVGLIHAYSEWDYSAHYGIPAMLPDCLTAGAVRNISFRGGHGGARGLGRGRRGGRGGRGGHMTPYHLDHHGRDGDVGQSGGDYCDPEAAATGSEGGCGEGGSSFANTAEGGVGGILHALRRLGGWHPPPSHFFLDVDDADGNDDTTGAVAILVAVLMVLLVVLFAAFVFMCCCGVQGKRAARRCRKRCRRSVLWMADAAAFFLGPCGGGACLSCLERTLGDGSSRKRRLRKGRGRTGVGGDDDDVDDDDDDDDGDEGNGNVVVVEEVLDEDDEEDTRRGQVTVQIGRLRLKRARGGRGSQGGRLADLGVLGYGSHGTVVLEGTLHADRRRGGGGWGGGRGGNEGAGRRVAVKRMLRTFASHADKEIALLIRSDGHPNVVRYFAKEVSRDFVYLALERCSASLAAEVERAAASLSRTTDLCAGREAGRQLWSSLPLAPPESLRAIMRDLVGGIAHLHASGILHRDIKPGNVLLSAPHQLTRKEESGVGGLGGGAQKGRGGTSASASPALLVRRLLDKLTAKENARWARWTAKISDMGLGRCVDNDLALPGYSEHSMSTTTGTVVGSLGWQAPEIVERRRRRGGEGRGEIGGLGEGTRGTESNEMEEMKIRRQERTNGKTVAADGESGQTPHAGFAADLFSAGCLVHYLTTSGGHPFGDPFEREGNILRRTPVHLDKLRRHPDVFELVAAMVHSNAHRRPSAVTVLRHRALWSDSKRLEYFQVLSDLVEDRPHLRASLEASAGDRAALFGGGGGGKAGGKVAEEWGSRLPAPLREEMERRRRYDYSSVSDLLRVLRNLTRHLVSLPDPIRKLLLEATAGTVQGRRASAARSEAAVRSSNLPPSLQAVDILDYFMRLFPRLLTHCCRHHDPDRTTLDVKDVGDARRVTGDAGIGSSTNGNACADARRDAGDAGDSGGAGSEKRGWVKDKQRQGHTVT